MVFYISHLFAISHLFWGKNIYITTIAFTYYKYNVL